MNAEQSFAPLFDVITGLARPGEPTPQEEALLWLRAHEAHQVQVASGAKPKTAKADLLQFLRRHAAWLTEGQSREALRVMVARQFRKFAHAETKGKSLAEAALDGRVARRGVATAPPIPADDVEKIAACALFNCGGRLAQAERELVDLRDGSGLSAATLDLMDTGRSKSYVNRRLVDAARPQIDTSAPYLLGKKTVDDATPSLQRDYSKLRSMQVVVADDYTLNSYWHLPDGKGWFELTRGQVLLFIDVRSLKIVTWVLIPQRNYDSLHIRTGMNTVCLEQGRPDVWYFERGLWQRSNLVKRRPPREWRLAHDSESETAYGWEKLGVRFIHAPRARSKPAELVGGLLQNLMEGCRGYCGRNERVDCPDETRKAILAVRARRVHPAQHFHSFDEWHVELGRIIGRYNAERQQGRILDGRSPDEAFEEFWPHDNPPVKFDPSCWHLCAHYVSERDVTVDGITFTVGKQQFAYFDAGHPEVIGVTDMTGKNPFFVQRRNPVDFLGSLDEDGPDGENYRRELAKQKGFASQAKARFQSAKATFNRTFRNNVVDRETAKLGQVMLEQRGEALKQSSEGDRRKARIVKLANRLNTPVETLRDFSEDTEQALQRTLQRRTHRMSTRKASIGSPLAQERYMSSVKMAENDGLKGMPVAAKAALYSDPRIRSLLFFLREISARPGGFDKVAADVLEMFPERLGSPTMHKLGVSGGQIYSAEQVRAVRNELDSVLELGTQGRFPIKGESGPRRWDEALRRADMGEEEWAEDVRRCEAEASKHPASYPASEFVQYCRDLATANLSEFLWEFCLDPRIELVSHNDRRKPPRLSTWLAGAGKHWNTETANLSYFQDITCALLEYRAHHQEQARARLAETDVSKAIFRTLERGLRSRGIVVVQGVEGVGKSYSGEAWRERHLGEAVFVRLEGIVTKTTFFQSISGACGLAPSVSQKSQEMQIRIRHFLERSGLMLIIDEAHRLFQQTERIYSHPELLNWVYTCWDQKIPVALLVTPQFVSRMDAVERQTDWRAGQLKRRIVVWTKLPEKLLETDLRAIAQNIAPRYSPAMLDELVDCALPSRRQIDAMRRAMSEAEFIADENGRKAPTFQDLLAGIADAQLTDQAMTTPLDRKRQANTSDSGRRTRRQRSIGSPMQDGCNSPAETDASADETEFTRAVTPSRQTRPQMAEATLG